MTQPPPNSQFDRYAVMGNPIAHSKSPLIHQAFAQQTGQPLHYEALLVSKEIGEFAKAVQTFQDQGGKGLNITIPFKSRAWELADHCGQRVQRAGAVNTLWFDEQGQRIGDNTDGLGLTTDLLKNHAAQIQGQRLLILGAGGAVRGVLEPLLIEQPALCVIANRTVSKAQELAELFGSFGAVSACGYEALAGQQFDLIINGTAASLQGELPPLPNNLFANGGWAYDMMYGSGLTLFLQWAIHQGAARALDGLGMLVEQAAAAFYLWRGVKPETPSVIQQLRQQLRSPPRQPRFSAHLPTEVNGPRLPEPTRYGDWEKNGRCIDF